jgi:sugar O-acyltransferase (sialic acid O-acetyltransferase NeuD family)
MKKLAILGASGHGKVVADAAEASGWHELVFYDDAWPELQRIGEWTVVGDTAALIRDAEHAQGAIVAIGNNRVRLEKIRELEKGGLPLVSVVHPSAVVSRHAAVGAGSAILAGAVVNAFANLGVGCIVNTGATIDHDCELGDAVHASPGAHLGGGVVVGSTTWIGIGACVKHSINIGRRVIVGAGAAVVSDVGNDMHVAGVPALPMKERG